LKWIEEFICDLFGLLLFGPAFVAAHRALLHPTHRSPYTFVLRYPTHPPYAARHKMLVRALKILQWDRPSVAAGDVYNAEMEALKYICADPYLDWASFFDDQQLTEATNGILSVLNAYGGFQYSPPASENLEQLVRMLVRTVPPIAAEILPNGSPRLRKTPSPHALYAGWVYWLGSTHLRPAEQLNFFDINRLCDQALLQECAMDKVAIQS
jgi:hypothetical protein